MMMGAQGARGVMISNGQRQVAEEADAKPQYAPGTVLNIAKVDTYAMEFVDSDGQKKQMTVHVAGDTMVLAHPTAERWTQELKQLTPSLQTQVLSRIKNAQEAAIAAQQSKPMVSVPVAKKIEEA